MAEEKLVFHLWDEEEQRFFTWGDESDPIMQRIMKEQVEFMEKLYSTAQWVIPTSPITRDDGSQYFPVTIIEEAQP